MIRPIIFSFGSVADHPGFIRFRRSCAVHGWTIDPRSGEWPGELPMWRMFFDSLPKYKEEGFTHALRLDAFDTITLGPPSELDPALAQYGMPAVLVSAEPGMWPGNYARAQEYEPRGGYWWFAHSPCTLDLRQKTPARLFEIPDMYAGDQTHFANLILDKEPGIAIDRGCRVVQALSHVNPWADAFVIEGRRVRNHMAGSLPIFAHGNGGPGTDMSWIPSQEGVNET